MLCARFRQTGARNASTRDRNGEAPHAGLRLCILYSRDGYHVYGTLTRVANCLRKLTAFLLTYREHRAVICSITLCPRTARSLRMASNGEAWALFAVVNVVSTSRHVSCQPVAMMVVSLIIAHTSSHDMSDRPHVHVLQIHQANDLHASRNEI